MWMVEFLEERRLFATTPNDAYFVNEWGMQTSGAESAWDITTGAPGLQVADIDTGIEYTHRDLYRNIWINQAEIPDAVRSKLKDTDKDGLITFWDLNTKVNRRRVNDVDGNGRIDASDLLAPYDNGKGGWADGINGATYAGDPYVDDIIGWDFADNDNDPMDHNGHGTHTAGTIGAMGDNRNGVAGMVWKTSLMALKIFDDNGSGAVENVIAAAIRYAVDAGARVSNNSWGATGGFGATLYGAIAYAAQKDHVFVVAAGNNGVNSDYSFLRSYPASYDLPNIITVASTDSFGALSYFSNYGARSVDLAAPGEGILSTYLHGKFAYLSGTSMATPHVTGAVALLLSANPDMSYAQVKGALMNSADTSLYLLGTSVSNGRLNVSRSLSLVTQMTTVASRSRSASADRAQAARIETTDEAAVAVVQTELWDEVWITARGGRA